MGEAKLGAAIGGGKLSPKLLKAVASLLAEEAQRRPLLGEWDSKSSTERQQVCRFGHLISSSYNCTATVDKEQGVQPRGIVRKTGKDATAVDASMPHNSTSYYSDPFKLGDWKPTCPQTKWNKACDPLRRRRKKRKCWQFCNKGWERHSVKRCMTQTTLHFADGSKKRDQSTCTSCKQGYVLKPSYAEARAGACMGFVDRSTGKPEAPSTTCVKLDKIKDGRPRFNASPTATNMLCTKLGVSAEVFWPRMLPNG